MNKVGLFFAIISAAMAGSSAFAQEPPVAEVEDIVVVARRTAAPVWEVTKDGRTLILVGAIRGLPKDLSWSPSGLEAATERADRILYPPEARASPADLLRLIWRARTIGALPRGTTTADHLSPELQARLEAVMATERNQGWRTRSLFVTGFDLLSDKAGYERGGRDVEDVVRAAARKARVRGETVGTVRGDEIVDNLITMPPSAYVPCIEAGLTAAEAGKDSHAARAEAWRRREVPAVLANPLDRALDRCWPWGDPELGPQLRGAWLTAIETAIQQDGVTLAVAPLRLLAEPAGVLDGLEARGFQIAGPAWKAQP